MLLESEDGLTPIENVAMPTAWRVRSGAASGELPDVGLCAFATESEAARPHCRCAVGERPQWVDWIDLRSDEMLFAGDGRIFRLRGWRTLEDGALLRAAEPLVDLREMSFQQMRPPSEAMRW